MQKLIEISAETLNRMSNKNQIIIWGAGGTLDDIINSFPEYEFEKKISCIVDSDSRKWNTSREYRGTCIKIYRPEILMDAPGNLKLIIASIHYPAILKQLDAMGLQMECYRFPKLKYDFQMEIKQKMKSESICTDLIVFKSSSDYSDNARVLFDYMIKQNLNKKYRLIWAVTDVNNYLWMKDIENVDVYCASLIMINAGNSIVSETEKYFKYLYTAKIFFVSHSLEWLRDRRAGQIVFNLWHGNGYKKSKIGKNHKDSFEYTCVTGPLYKIYQSRFFCCDEKKAIVTGHPKTDLFFTCDIKTIRAKLALNGYKKLLVWMPTFRRSTVSTLNEETIICETGIPIVRTFSALSELNRELQKRNLLLVVKLHQYQNTDDYTHETYTNIRIWDNGYIMEKDIQPNELLACADALITDYSSTAIDYLSVDRTIGFAIDDMEEYTKGRQFLFNPIEDYMPGYILTDMDTLLQFILDIDEGADQSIEKRRRLLPQMMAYQDGNSCKRILEFLKLI